MLGRILIRWGIIAVAVYVAARLLSGVDVSEGLGALLLVSAVLGLVNAILGTFLRIITIPILLLTFGLFLIAINIFVLWITTLLTDDLVIHGFWSYFWAAIIISLVTILLRWVLPEPKRA